MKILSVSLIVVGAVALSSSVSFAHDPSKHKGKPLVGEIVESSASSFTLKTPSESVKVTINDKTRIEAVNREGTFADLKSGDVAHVFGTRLANGDMVAREVVLSDLAATPNRNGEVEASHHGRH